MERLELDLKIDHDYVARVDLQSSMRRHHLQAEIFDLEFTLKFPLLDDDETKSKATNGEDTDAQGNATTLNGQSVSLGAVRLRSNIAADASWEKVPGELVIQYDPHWFDERSQRYSDWQKDEWVYYKDCPYCHRSRYEFRSQGCNRQCLWRRVYSNVEVARSRQDGTPGGTG
jgi:molecular chaperone DnaK